MTPTHAKPHAASLAEPGMIRLDCAGVSNGQVILHISGHIAHNDLGVLDAQLGEWLGVCDRVVLDLHDVRHIDPEGLRLLHSYHGPRVVLRGGSAYVRELLWQDRLTPDDGPSTRGKDQP